MTRETLKSIIVILLAAALVLAGGCRSTTAPDVASGIRVEPALEENLYSYSRVVLEEVTISPGVIDQQYPGADIGQPALIVTVVVRNMDPDNFRVAMFAYGYNCAGERVAGTLDAEGVSGQITLVLKHGEAGPFTLHLDTHEEVESVRIFAFTYGGTSL